MTETPTDPPRPDDSAPGPWERRRGMLRLLVVLPIVVAVVRALITGWFPVGDSALLAVRAFDVGTHHHPLLGSWTSASLALGVDVNNPGPLYPDLAAPFMWTVGRALGIGPATALAVGAINVAAAIGTIAAGRALGGWRAERWMLVLVAALCWTMGSELLIDIWQPHSLLLPFVCLLVLSAGIVGGRLRLAPWWLAVLSLVVQTHVGYVYLAVALSGLVAVALVRRLVAEARGQSRTVGETLAAWARRRITWVCATVVGVAWLQPVIEQFTSPGAGNLQRLATNAGGGDITVGAAGAVKILAAAAAIPPSWTRWGFADAVPSSPLVPGPDGPQLVLVGLPGGLVSVVSLGVVVALLVLLVVRLRAPEQRPARAAAVVALVALVVAVGGVAIQTVSVTGLRDHQVQWVFALAVMVHVTIAWGLVDLLRSRRVTWPVPADAALIGVTAVLVVANLPFHAHDLGTVADRESNATLERTFDDLADFRPAGPVIEDTSNIRLFSPYPWAIVMRLRELGVEVRFEHEVDIRQYGESRRADGTEVGRVRQFERSDALLYDGPGCTLSLRSGVSADDEANADALIAAAVDDLTSGTVAVDTTGLPDDVTTLVDAALDGDRAAATRFVASGLVPVLVDEGRTEPTPALSEAARADAAIIARVNSTVRVVVEPADLC